MKIKFIKSFTYTAQPGKDIKKEITIKKGTIRTLKDGAAKNLIRLEFAEEI
jgi:hypothetical protein